MSEPQFIQLPPGSVTRALEMREAANARAEGEGDILLALAQLYVVTSIAGDQLARLGMPETAKTMAQMLGLVCRVLGATPEDLNPYVAAIREDSADYP